MALLQHRTTRVRTFPVLSVLVGILLSVPVETYGERLTSDHSLSTVVSVRDMHNDNGAIAGVVVNHSADTIRDVTLLVRHSWHWKKEFHPGSAERNPGRAYYFTVSGDIPAGGTRPFTYQLPDPASSRADGHFDTAVQVAGFTEVQVGTGQVIKLN